MAIVIRRLLYPFPHFTAVIEHVCAAAAAAAALDTSIAVLDVRLHGVVIVACPPFIALDLVLSTVAAAAESLSGSASSSWDLYPLLKLLKLVITPPVPACLPT